MGSVYDPFAEAYERWFGPEAAPESWASLRTMLLPRLRPGARVLDLCCGTGEISARLLRRGCRVLGVDGSRAMLAYARRRAPGARLVAADLAGYVPTGRFDAAVAAYNSLAELTDIEALGGLLARVRGALRPGGVFVFDVYDPDAYRVQWRGSYCKEGEGLRCEVRARFRPRLRRGELRIALRSSAGVRRVAIITRAYGHDEITAVAAAAGFTGCEARRTKSGRVFYRAFTRAR